MSSRHGQGDIDTNADDHGGLAAVWASNPQAGRSESSFSSAVRRNETTPSNRRRGSDGVSRHRRTDHDPWSRDGGPHSRSRTVDDEAGGRGGYWLSASRSTSQHPLRSSSSQASSSSWTLDHDTRPSIRRVLSDSDAFGDLDSDTYGEQHEEGLSGQDPETLMIVHEVQPKDSLAGVALKYGITLADLRRANHLWTSDSIHLRKVLHIPVDKTRQAKQYREALIDTYLSTEMPIPITEPPDGKDNIPSADPHLPDVGKLTIRRVPASQLSYFPPPTHLSSLSSDNSSAVLRASDSTTLPNGKSIHTRPGLSDAFIRPHESPLQGVIDVFTSSLQSTANHVRAYSQSTASFFSGPAVRAPTTIASRISLDSASGTPSSTSDDLEWEHELEDVSAAQISRRRNDRRRAHVRQASTSLNDLHSSSRTLREEEERNSVELDSGPFSAMESPPSPRTPTHRHRRNSSGRSQHAHIFQSGSSSGGRGRARQRGMSVPYAGGAEEEGTAEWDLPTGRSISSVRTAQLQPSPGMQLPPMVRKRIDS